MKPLPARRDSTAERLQHFLERPIRIHAARAATADDCRAAHAAHHRSDHLSQHALSCQNRHRDAGRAVLALSALSGCFTCCGYNLSVAVWVGLIALAGLDAETGVVMLLYLDLAYEQWQREGKMRNARRLARRHLSRRSETRPPQSDDRCGHHRRPCCRSCGATARART